MGAFGTNLYQSKLPGGNTILALRVTFMGYHVDISPERFTIRTITLTKSGLVENCSLDWEARDFTLLTNSYSSYLTEKMPVCFVFIQ